MTEKHYSNLHEISKQLDKNLNFVTRCINAPEYNFLKLLEIRPIIQFLFHIIFTTYVSANRHLQVL